MQLLFTIYKRAASCYTPDANKTRNTNGGIMSETPLTCPVCAAPLSSVKSHDITIDICTSCKGAWFDAGELKALVDAEIKERSDIPDAPIEKPDKVIVAHKVAESARSCPRCHVPMKKVNYGYDSNVVVDHCTSCNGTWTDGGEVYKLAIYMKGNPTRKALGEALLGEVRQFSALSDLSDSIGSMQKRTGLPRLLSVLGMFSLVPAGVMTMEDKQQRRHFPLVTLSLVLASVIAVLLYKILGYDPKLFGFLPQAFHGSRPYTMVTYGILYSGIVHLMFTMIFLWLFGDNVEDRFGKLGFLGFFLGSLVLAAALQSSFHPNQTMPVVGGGVAVSAILGAYLALYSFSRISLQVLTSSIQIPAFVFVMAWIAVQMMISLWAFAAETAMMPWYFHILLFIVGFIMGLVVRWAVPQKEQS